MTSADCSKHVCLSNGHLKVLGSTPSVIIPFGDFAVSAVDDNIDYCKHCKKGGTSFECDGCNLSFHAKCLRHFGISIPSEDENEPFYCSLTSRPLTLTNTHKQDVSWL